MLFSLGPFETNVGRQSALQADIKITIIGAFSNEHFQPWAFDTLGYFDDNWDQLDPEQLWEQILSSMFTVTLGAKNWL